MKRVNKRIICALGTALTVAAVGSTNVSANSTGTTKVSYTHASVVPENPTNPGGSKWGVSIPTDISFITVGDTKKVDLELKGMNGTATADIKGKVRVTVASANTWKLKNGSSEIAYTVNYAGQENASIGNIDLTATAPKKAGNASLKGPVAATTPEKDHTDTLTYTMTAVSN